MTQLIRGILHLKQVPSGGVVTIGNFDGVHLGHQALLNKLTQHARTHHVPSIVLTFEPQPQVFFSGIKKPRLTSFCEKLALMQTIGIDYVVLLHFNQAMADLNAQQFIQTILLEGLRAQHIIVGHDFHFGRGREGDIHLLQQQKKLTVEEMPPFILENERVSSTCIRQCLSENDFAKAKHYLGYPWMIAGRVMYGAQRGRLLGFPTANIFLGKRALPVGGVYAVKLHGIAAKGLPGVANVGVRPTVDGTRQILEVHLFDFNGTIYGKRVQVEFCHKIRDEVRFANLDLLKEQIRKDAEIAKRYFE
ncbi:MAG: bifunctional riboflavin kinase/FAD synthetase [Gammaproteobacteria bacterium]|nr:bifunctional riboflavin kinase/FAD synthetase [Gammaproteobacteria bacterium]